MTESTRTFMSYIAIVLGVLLVGAIAIAIHEDGKLRGTGREIDFKSYISVCTRAGHTAEECLFVKHHPEEARILRGSH